ncbi:MAG: hypothetical protein PHD51_04380 [Patescibacteria group bacterium]|nr:hypothetical protein [Patescibacteria group bacterium]MDD5490860.1 hypothetical protein [Patescibacteria group bacterium]
MENGKSTIRTDQFAALASAVIRSLPRDMDTKTAQEWIQNPNALNKVLRKALILPVEITLEMVKKIYTDLGIDCEFPADVKIPTGDVWPVVVPKGMTPGEAFAIASKLFPTWKYVDDLDKTVSEKAKKTTVRFFKANIEADEEHRNKSAKDVKKEGIQGITLTERILLEIVYFKVMGGHLDKGNVTLCAGSRGSDGGVPYAYWSDDGFGVYWYDPDNALPRLRVRSVV